MPNPFEAILDSLPLSKHRIWRGALGIRATNTGNEPQAFSTTERKPLCIHEDAWGVLTTIRLGQTQANREKGFCRAIGPKKSLHSLDAR